MLVSEYCCGLVGLEHRCNRWDVSNSLVKTDAGTRWDLSKGVARWDVVRSGGI
jgi:hypothetical protein